MESIITTARAVLLDWDGCLAFGNKPTPDAVRVLSILRGRAWIVSNNSSDTATRFAALLSARGAVLPAERIVLAGETMLRIVAERHPKARILLIGGSALRRQAQRLHLKPVRDDADVVLLCRDAAFDYHRLSMLSAAVQTGVPFYVANPDAWHPGPGGSRVPETGSLLAAVRTVVPECAPIVIGKPQPYLFDHVLKTAGVAPDQAVMIGDNPDTDLEGAKRAGVAGVLLGSPQLPSLSSLIAQFKTFNPSAPDRGIRHAYPQT